MSNYPLPHASRNVVFTALYNYLVTNVTPPPGFTKWNTTSQFLKQWDQVPNASQPAMYLYRGPQTAIQTKAFGIIRHEWKVTVWVYYRTDGFQTTNTYPDQLTDVILDNFEQAFQTDPLAKRTTLGTYINSTNGNTEDICQECYINGTVYYDSGLSDGQGLAIIPVSILL